MAAHFQTVCLPEKDGVVNGWQTYKRGRVYSILLVGETDELDNDPELRRLLDAVYLHLVEKQTA